MAITVLTKTFCDTADPGKAPRARRAMTENGFMSSRFDPDLPPFRTTAHDQRPAPLWRMPERAMLRASNGRQRAE
jgi:hypothetical protein